MPFQLGIIYILVVMDQSKSAQKSKDDEIKRQNFGFQVIWVPPTFIVDQNPHT